MNIHSFILLLVLIYLISLVNFSSTQCTPVYMWGNLHYRKPTSPLQVIDQEWQLDFFKNRVDTNTPIVVFAEQSLSSEDFLLHNENGESIFTTLSPSEKSFNYWPCAVSPVEAFDKLKDRNIVKTSSNRFWTESIELKPKDVLIIDLNDADEGEDRINMLRRHDENIGKIHEYFKKQFNDITMLFTGRQPSWITVDEIRSHRHRRDTTKAEAGTPSEGPIQYVVYSNEDVLISALDSPELVNGDTKVSLKGATITTENKSETGLTIKMVAKDVADINWIFQVGGGYWILKNITVSKPQSTDVDYYFRVKDIYAPHRFSYHCVNQPFIYPRNPLQKMTFEYLQLQIFFDGEKQDGKFGDAFDCTGFMSAAIWSGLFVTFILVLIMTCGLTMMMDIKTMDRFDDPKGKTITINASE